jgi:hypothetical protein
MLANSESTPGAAEGPRPGTQHGSFMQRTRLRDTLVSLALFAGLLWVMSQSAFAQVAGN